MLEFKSLLVIFFGGICIVNTVSTAVPPCIENRTETCRQDLATFTTLDKPKFVSGVELERLCRNAEDGQRCSSDFLRSSSCVNSEDHLLISLQIGRSQAVSQMLCSNGGYITNPAFRKLYLKHESCIEDHEKKIKECFDSSSIVDDPEFEIVKNSSKSTKEKQNTACCPLVKYIECAENAIGRSCGTESKSVVLRTLLKIAGKQLEDFCTNLDPEFPDSPTECMNSAVIKDFSLPFYFAVHFLVFALTILL